MTETLRNRIARHEGCKLKPYTDTVGKLTIGCGRNLTDKGISIDEAYALLDNDIAEVQRDVAANLPWTVNLPDQVREVLEEMAFQIGIYGLLQFKGTLKALQNGDYHGASESMLASLWANQTPVRAKELAAMVQSATT